jgi:MFS family permease
LAIATPEDVRRLIAARGLRGFADGAVSVLLAGYLTDLGFTPFQVGVTITGTLVGSALLTLAVGLVGHRLRRKGVLLAAAALMAATGIGFAGLTTFWPLLAVAVVGTLNPSSGDVSVFLPVEQAALAESEKASRLTRTFARYNLSGTLMGALGALASGIPEAAARALHVNVHDAERLGFVVYVLVAVLVAIIYRGLSPAIEHRGAPAAPLARSRAVVFELTALFSIDSFGGGLVVQSLLVLWLDRRFHLPMAATGTIFFVAGLLAAFSQLMSARLAARIGRIRTMVYTHLPANFFLIIAGLAPSAPVAVAFLLLRMALSSMDVPARQSYVMAIVPPEERAAAASVTNVPRSFATALAPLLTGAMLERSSFGWPLVIAGALKVVYDLLLLARFRAVRAPGEP